MSNDVIDENAIHRLLEVIGGNKQDLLELVQEFEASTPKTLEKLRTAATEEIIDTLRISAHSLKSNGRDFGAIRLANLCANLEHECKSGEVSAPLEKVAEIQHELDLAREALGNIQFSND